MARPMVLAAALRLPHYAPPPPYVGPGVAYRGLGIGMSGSFLFIGGGVLAVVVCSPRPAPRPSAPGGGSPMCSAHASCGMSVCLCGPCHAGRVMGGGGGGTQVRSGQVRYCQSPPSVDPLSSVRSQEVWPKHTHSEAQRGHQPLEKRPDPDGA